MPAGVSIANKTGELSDVENDAGIIYNSSNDLIIVFMSENVLQPGTAQSTIAALSRHIYDSYSSEDCKINNRDCEDSEQLRII